MNWMLLIVCAILGIYTILGYAKGFLKMAYSMVSWILIFIIVACGAPRIEGYIKGQTGIYEKIVAHCEKNVREQTLERLEKEEGIDYSELSDNELMDKLLEKLPIETIEKMKKSSKEAAEKFLDEKGVYSALAISTADMIVKGISYIIAFLLGSILSAFIQKMLGFLSKLPLIGFANRICGLGAGLISGLIIVWILFCFIALLSNTTLARTAISYIQENAFLTYLYEKNIILSFLL